MPTRQPPREPRRYDGTRRQEQARLTRRSVLAAAHRRFVDDGYAATTIASVAADAGVSVETIYKSIGKKPELAKAVFDVAIAGDDEDVPLMEREFIERNIAEPDPHRKIAEYVAFFGEAAHRVGPILLVVRDAAVSDPGAAAVWEQLQAERLFGMTMFAQHLDEGGHLRDGVSWEEARDVLWTHNSVEIWDLLVRQRGWSGERFGGWLVQQLTAALL